MAAAASDPNDYGEAGIRDLCARLLDRSLPKARWTRHAHLAATLCLVRTRPEGLPQDLPHIIRRYNEAVGGVNDDTQGYHETITQAYLAAIGAFAAALPETTSLGEACARLFATNMADREWPLRYWSKARLFSVEARREWVAPDLAPPPFPRAL